MVFVTLDPGLIQRRAAGQDEAGFSSPRGALSQEGTAAWASEHGHHLWDSLEEEHKQDA